jgi:hypothetical protein
MRVTARRPARPSPAIVAWGLASLPVAFTISDVWMAAENGTSGPAQVVNVTLILVAIVGAMVASRMRPAGYSALSPSSAASAGLLGTMATGPWPSACPPIRGLVCDLARSPKQSACGTEP